MPQHRTERGIAPSSGCGGRSKPRRIPGIPHHERTVPQSCGIFNIQTWLFLITVIQDSKRNCLIDSCDEKRTVRIDHFKINIRSELPGRFSIPSGIRYFRRHRFLSKPCCIQCSDREVFIYSAVLGIIIRADSLVYFRVSAERAGDFSDLAVYDRSLIAGTSVDFFNFFFT